VIGLGVDVCSVERMRAALARTPGIRDRIFTAAEQAYCDRRRQPAERYAARFAAKEAVLKAMGVGIGACRLRDIEVVRAESGEPCVELHATAAGLAADRGVRTWRVSMSHDGGVAFAVAVAFAE
jgi:holo-[acyl-carrier protein] synthase